MQGPTFILKVSSLPRAKNKKLIKRQNNNDQYTYFQTLELLLWITMQLSEPTSLVLSFRIKLRNALGFQSSNEVTHESVNRKKKKLKQHLLKFTEGTKYLTTPSKHNLNETQQKKSNRVAKNKWIHVAEGVSLTCA